MLLSNIDDAFIDFYHIIYKINRKFFVYRKYRPFQPEDILAKEEQYFAILIPAWREASVIQAMLKNTLASYNYTNYHIFVGCYPNDPDTISQIEAIQSHYHNLHVVRLTYFGPTSKADCLNQVYDNIMHHESTADFEYAGFILHDAEDIVHPLELKLYNHLIPRKDMVQIPVIPLERPWYDLTGGHYQDEFAENHIKDIVVRESLTGHVPSAGVGTALSRRAMNMISHNQTTKPFDISNLTEDYDLALRLKKYNLKLIFARFQAGPDDIIATREFFPNTIISVIRQKSRWLMGITFQGWLNQRWHGSLMMRYALYRDRKAIITSFLAIFAYFIILNIMGVWLIAWALLEHYSLPPLVRSGDSLSYMLMGNFFFLTNRVLHRFYFTQQIYGVLNALLSFPRQLWGNVLNFMASVRAIYLYSNHIVFDTPLVWDKTDHVFPNMAQLIPYHKKLGEFLLQNKAIAQDNLRHALSLQHQNGGKIGAILIEKGYITNQQLSEALSLQEAQDE